MLPVNLWLLTRVLFVAHAAAGSSDTRLSLRPLPLEGQNIRKTSDASRRENDLAHLFGALKIASSEVLKSRVLKMSR
jgi:hypothetical protein